MTTAYEALLAKIHAIITARDLDVTADPTEIRRIAETETERFQREATIGAERFPPFADPGDVVARLVRDISSVGSELDEWIAHPDVEEMWGIDGELWARMTTGEVVAVPTPTSALAVRNQVERFVAAAGEQLDASHPRADGVRVWLPGGRQGRLSASIPPRVDGTIDFTLRLPKKRHTTLEDLVLYDALSSVAARFLAVLMLVPRVKVLVVGPPGAGKTTLIEALLRAVSPRRHVIVAEENRELSAPLLNGKYWATSKVEDLADLIRSARVNFPQLIVLGELKGPEAWDLAMAGNLGTGVIAAVHADSASLGFEALATCASLAVPAMSEGEIRAKFARIFDVVIYVDMDDSDDEKTLRQITEISVVPPQMSTAGVAVTPIFARADIGEPMELHSTTLGELLERKCDRVLRRHRVTIGEVLNGTEVYP